MESVQTYYKLDCAAASALIFHFYPPATSLQPLLRTPALVHHMVLFGCTSPPATPVTGDVYDCLRMQPECSAFTLGTCGSQVAGCQGPGLCAVILRRLHAVLRQAASNVFTLT